MQQEHRNRSGEPCVAYRSTSFGNVATPLTGVPCERASVIRLGGGPGGTRLIGLHIGPGGWVDLGADNRARYGVVVKGDVAFIDDHGALEVITPGSTFGSDAGRPLELRSAIGCDLFIVEMDHLDAPSHAMDNRLLEQRAEQAKALQSDARAGQPWWERLIGRVP